MSHRNVGDLGEATLESWCAQVGIEPNRVRRDRTGWDNLLEFPLEEDLAQSAQGALDKHPASLRAFVQVKSRDKRGRSIGIKVDNLVRLMQASDPAFFLILDFDSQQEARAAHLVEVGHGLITKVQKKLRELSAKGRLGDLKRRTISIRVEDGIQLNSLDGLGLRRAIENSTGRDLEAYRARKAHWKAEVGYETANLEGRLDFIMPEPYASGDPDELLVDFDIGVLSEVEIVSGAMWDLRFGIRAPEPHVRFDAGGSFRMNRDPNSAGPLVFRSQGDGEELRIQAEAFGPSGVAHLIDRSKWKFRFVMPGAQLVVAPNRGRTQFSFRIPDPDDVFSLSELADVARVAAYMSAHSGTPIDFSFRGLKLGTLTSDSFDFDESVLSWCQVVRQAEEVARAFGVLPETKLSTSDLWPERERLSLMVQVFRNRPSCTLDVDLELPGPDLTLRGCVPLVTLISMGERKLLAQYALLGPLRQTSRSDKSVRCRLTVDDVALKRKSVLELVEPLPGPERELRAAIADEYEASHEVILMED